jgi:putative transposase
MTKLNLRKIRWIIRNMKENELSVGRIAGIQGVSKMTAYRVYNKFGDVPLYGIKKLDIGVSGRKSTPFTDSEIDIIKRTKLEYGFGAVNIEKVLKSQGINMSHNRIHNALLDLNLANLEPKKQRRRKWVRYERRYSNSLWHTDYHEINRQHIIPFLDDASRFITGYGLFKDETADNAAVVFEKAIQYGVPKQLISDHGTHFISLKRETCPDPEFNVFQKKLYEYKVQHILARVKHPQTNGKMERWFGTLDRLTRHFNGDIERAIHVYNFVRPHMSLDRPDGSLRTPYQAFQEKMRKN